MSIIFIDTSKCLTDTNFDLIHAVFSADDKGNIVDQLSASTYSILCDGINDVSSQYLSNTFRLSILHIVNINYTYGFVLSDLNRNIPRHKVNRWISELNECLSKDEKLHKQALLVAMDFTRNRY